MRRAKKKKVLMAEAAPAGEAIMNDPEEAAEISIAAAAAPAAQLQLLPRHQMHCSWSCKMRSLRLARMQGRSYIIEKRCAAQRQLVMWPSESMMLLLMR